MFIRQKATAIITEALYELRLKIQLSYASLAMGDGIGVVGFFFLYRGGSRKKGRGGGGGGGAELGIDLTWCP